MTTPSKRVPWSRGDRLLMIVLALVVTVAGLGVWFQGRDRMPTLVVPTPAMPSPNAFDFYSRASAAVVGDAIISPSTPHPPPVPTAAQVAVIQQNAGAIALLHQGFLYPLQEPPVRSFSTPLPQYQHFRALARMLGLAARVDAARGDWAGAMGASLDAVQMGETIPRGGSPIGMLVGTACENIGRHPTWGYVDHLTAAQARANARRLQAIRAGHVPFADTVQEEEWTGQAGLLELMRRRGWPGNFTDQNQNQGNNTSSSSPSLSDTFSAWQTASAIRRVGRQAILSHYTRYMDQAVANARQPYAAHPPDPALPDDPINRLMDSSNLPSMRINETRSDTQNALLLTLLALRAYRLEHGAFPATLSALVPGYLQSVPDDPFALSDPLRYKLIGGKYVLYSVGPDGKDDGGKPIFDTTKPAPSPPRSTLSDNRYWAQPDSRGDIVAGVNGG